MDAGYHRTLNKEREKIQKENEAWRQQVLSQMLDTYGKSLSGTTPQPGQASPEDPWTKLSLQQEDGQALRQAVESTVHQILGQRLPPLENSVAGLNQAVLPLHEQHEKTTFLGRLPEEDRALFQELEDQIWQEKRQYGLPLEKAFRAVAGPVALERLREIQTKKSSASQAMRNRAANLNQRGANLGVNPKSYRVGDGLASKEAKQEAGFL